MAFKNLKKDLYFLISNLVSLGKNSTLESNLKPLKVGEKNTPIEISEDGVNISGTLKVNHVDVSTDPDANTITALNSATENELVTVGATTTELESEANLTFTGSILTLLGGQRMTSTSSNQLLIRYDESNYVGFDVASTGALEIATVGAGLLDSHLTLDVDGQMLIECAGGIKLKEALSAVADTAAYGQIWVKNTAPNTLWFTDDTGYDCQIAPLAGAIIGYTCVGEDVADDYYTLTTSFVCFQDSGGTEIKVSFITPPSEFVEIEVSLFFSAGSGAQDLELSLSDNATYGSSGLHHEDNLQNTVCEPARGNGGTIVHKWLLEAAHLEAIGSSNDIFIAARCHSTIGTPIIKWG